MIELYNPAHPSQWQAEMREQDLKALAEAKGWEAKNRERLEKKILADGSVVFATKERINKYEDLFP